MFKSVLKLPSLPEYSEPELSDPTDSVFLCVNNLESKMNCFSVLVRPDAKTNWQSQLELTSTAVQLEFIGNSK